MEMVINTNGKLSKGQKSKGHWQQRSKVIKVKSPKGQLSEGQKSER